MAFSLQGLFQDSQLVPEIPASIEPYMYYAFLLYIHTNDKG
jgi:hypothetical protein